MKWLWKSIQNIFASHKTAIFSIATAAALAGFQNSQGGKVNWAAVGAAAVTAVGAMAKSPLTPKADAPTGDSSPN